MRSIEVNNQSGEALNAERLCQAVDLVLQEAGYVDADVSIAIVGDQTIWQLNRRHLQHDYPTDVLSFRLDNAENFQHLEGEIVVSIDTARRESQQIGWSLADELLLYVLHGALHLIGHDDADDSGRSRMRAAESQYLSRIEPRLGERHAQTSSDLDNHQHSPQ